MALKASEYPSAAANVFLGFSILVVGLMIRDRFSANVLYITDNKDVYLLVVRIGFIFLSNGLIAIEEINKEHLLLAQANNKGKQNHFYLKSTKR